MMNFTTAMFYVFVLLQLMDAFSTTYGMRLGYREKNPLLAWLFDRVGVEITLAVVKTAIVAYVWHNLEDIPVILLVIFNGVYAYIFYKNLEVISREE